MIIAFWIVAGLLALAFLAAGLMKVVRPKAALMASGLSWVQDFTGGAVKLIGAAEIFGAIGLVVPRLAGVAPILSPIAAVALAVLMLGAVTVHVRRREQFLPPLVLAVLSLAAAILGFGALS